MAPLSSAKLHARSASPSLHPAYAPRNAAADTLRSFSHGAGSFSSSPWGPKENPYAEGFSAGGSSSGCGALIGGGLVDMGIGGDQGGSIRIVSLPGSLGAVTC